MRNLLLYLLLVLILANIFYFLWGFVSLDDSNPGIAILEEADLGPPLDITTGQDSDAITSVGAVLGSGEPSDLEAVVGRSCVTIGPFRENDDADSAVLEYNNEGMRAALRSGRGQIFVGHSVQILSVPTRDAGRAMLARLAEAGLGDAFIVGNEEDGLAISLGIFGNADNAERIELQAESAAILACHRARALALSSRGMVRNALHCATRQPARNNLGPGPLSAGPE
jgi:hypothetical protein